MLEKSERPWGRYEVLQEGATYKVKSLHVSPGKRLSYQRHQKRNEHWYITDGSGEVTLDGKVQQVSRGSIIEVPQGTLHRISNTGNSELIFIEVQTGSYFGEDDIERVEDDFGRN
jgi:mannose-6-phosphate isomerase